MADPLFRSRELVADLARALGRESAGLPQMKLMHVCGTHEHELRRFALRSLLPENVELVAGPGCPVCITPAFAIATAMRLAGLEPAPILATYGDIVNVPIESGTLMGLRAEGLDVRIVYGPRDAIKLAAGNPGREVVFFSVGFETTAAPVASLLLSTLPENFSIYCCHRYVPAAVEALAGLDKGFIAGYLLPGHASVITGSDAYDFLPRRFGVPAAVAGFEPVDILSGLLSIVRQIAINRPTVANCYPRAVRPEGNKRAQAALEDAFDLYDAAWRGIGVLPRTGYRLKDKVSGHDALLRFGIDEVQAEDIMPGCQCHLVVLGRKRPSDCGLFGRQCTPQNPTGPCMVGGEGTCRAAFLFPEREDV